MPRETTSTHEGLRIAQIIFGCPPKESMLYPHSTCTEHLSVEYVDYFLSAPSLHKCPSQGLQAASSFHSSQPYGAYLPEAGVGELPKGDFPVGPSASLHPMVAPCSAVRLRRCFRVPKPLEGWDPGILPYGPQSTHTWPRPGHLPVDVQ